MKQTIKFLAIVALSAAIAFAIGFIVLVLTGSMEWFASVFIFGGLLAALAIGAFDIPDNAKRESIRHHDRSSYGQAAIFIGTACVFMGTPQDCEEFCDDLWHRGVQAEYRTLTGDETFEIL